ncbi:MAG: hypothetical protein WBI04_06620 [Trichlorobacter sp.]|jgi:rRNA-processing protein FCF1
MAETARKLNFMISQEVAKDLETLIPHGQRSKLVSEAIRKELERYKRWMVTEKLLNIRGDAPETSAKAILNAIKYDRRRG